MKIGNSLGKLSLSQLRLNTHATTSTTQNRFTLTGIVIGTSHAAENEVTVFIVQSVEIKKNKHTKAVIVKLVQEIIIDDAVFGGVKVL